MINLYIFLIYISIQIKLAHAELFITRVYVTNPDIKKTDKSSIISEYIYTYQYIRKIRGNKMSSIFY